jgi:hypothetical protein
VCELGKPGARIGQALTLHRFRSAATNLDKTNRLCCEIDEKKKLGQIGGPRRLV